MLTPTFIYDQLVTEEGNLTPTWRIWFDQLITQMENNISNNTFVIPAQPTTIINDYLAAKYPSGSLTFDSTTDQLKVRLNDGEYHAIDTAGGTVTSLTAGTGITLTPDPITTVGTIAIDSTLPMSIQDNITALGTISAGTWQGSPIAVTYGGCPPLTYSVTNIVTTPASGSCAISFQITNTDGSNPAQFSVIPIIVYAVPATLSSISAGTNTNFYSTGTYTGYVSDNADATGVINITVTGSASADWALGVILQAGNMAQIPFTIS